MHLLRMVILVFPNCDVRERTIIALHVLTHSRFNYKFRRQFILIVIVNYKFRNPVSLFLHRFNEMPFLNSGALLHLARPATCISRVAIVRVCVCVCMLRMEGMHEKEIKFH